MGEKVTRLAYIMSRLGIRAEEVSKRTGIDKTLISRWKNGQRRLSPASVYSKQISSFLLSLDKAESIVGKTLSAYGLDESNGSLQDNFIFWLAEQDTPSPSLRNIQQEPNAREYTASFRMFLGNEGLRSAIITMIDYVMTLPGPQEVVAVALSDFGWVTEEPAFFELLIERMRIAFERGVTLTLVSRENFSEDMSRFSGLWLAAHLKGYIKSYYYKEKDKANSEQIFLAVKNGVCLRLEHDYAAPDGRYAVMNTDKVTVRHVYNNSMEYFSRANMQFRYSFFEKPGVFLKSVHSGGLIKDDCYVCAQEPGLGVINNRQAHLFAKETLRDSRQRTDQVKALFNPPHQFAPEATVRHIYCLESLEELLAPGRTVNYPLSAIYEKRIHHSHKLVLEQLNNIRNWLQTYENYQLALVPRQLFDKIPLEFMCVQNNFCVAWMKEADASTCVKDYNKVDALFGYAEHMWQGLPRYTKNRANCLRQLNHWLGNKGNK